MLQKLFLGIILAGFVFLVIKVLYFEEEVSFDDLKPSTTMKEVAEELGEKTEEVNDNLVKGVMKDVEKAIDYFRD